MEIAGMRFEKGWAGESVVMAKRSASRGKGNGWEGRYVRRSFDVSELSFCTGEREGEKESQEGLCGWENRGLGCWYLNGKARLVFGVWVEGVFG
jgi:hypothetical protein